MYNSLVIESYKIHGNWNFNFVGTRYCYVTYKLATALFTLPLALKGTKQKLWSILQNGSNMETRLSPKVKKLLLICLHYIISVLIKWCVCGRKVITNYSETIMPIMLKCFEYNKVSSTLKVKSHLTSPLSNLWNDKVFFKTK